MTLERNKPKHTAVGIDGTVSMVTHSVTANQNASQTLDIPQHIKQVLTNRRPPSRELEWLPLANQNAAARDLPWLPLTSHGGASYHLPWHLKQVKSTSFCQIVFCNYGLFHFPNKQPTSLLFFLFFPSTWVQRKILLFKCHITRE